MSDRKGKARFIMIAVVAALLWGACDEASTSTPSAAMHSAIPTPVGETPVGRGGQSLPTAAVPSATELAGSPMPAAADCPGDPRICEFARQLGQWLVGGNLDEIIGTLEAKTFQCPEPSPLGLGGPYPLCDGSQAGTSRRGYELGRLGSEGGVLSEVQYRQLLQR